MTHEHHDHAALYSNLKVERKPHSEAEITGDVPADAAAAYRPKAIRRLGANVEIPGFRKGHVPEPMLVERLGEQRIMEEIAELALSHAYAHIVEDEKLDVVGRPSVVITKLAPGNPIGFKITTALYPTVELPDYKKLARDARAKADDPEKTAVADEEVQKELERLRDILDNAMKTAEQNGDNAVAPEAGDTSNEKAKEPRAIDDDFARMVGEFTDLADLKNKLRSQMLMDKNQKAHEKRRLAIVDAILAKVKTDIPALFVDGELSQMMASFEDRVGRAGLKVDEYLKSAGKTTEDLRREWRPDAEKRAKMQLALTEIAKKEGIAPDPERLEREVAHVIEHYKDADPSAVRAFTASQMTNDLVFQMLEKDGEA